MTPPNQNMTPKTIATLILIAAALPVAGFDDLDAMVRDKIINPDRDRRDLSWVTPKLRDEIIQRFKSQLPDPLRNADAEDGLLTLGDDETIERLIRQHHEWDDRAWVTLEASAREGVVARLIGDVTDNTTPKQVEGSDVIPASRRRLSTGIILTSIKRSPAFPERTRRWASHASDMLGVGFSPAQEQVYSQTLEWWAKNKDAVLARRYENATWVPPEAISIRVTAQAESPNAAKRVWPPTHPETSSASHGSDRTFPSPSGSVAIVGKHDESGDLAGGWGLWGGIVAAFAVAAGWLFLCRQRK